jgi:hypothetical protein
VTEGERHIEIMSDRRERERVRERERTNEKNEHTRHDMSCNVRNILM